MKKILNGIDLTLIDYEYGKELFENMVRVDDLLFSSKITNEEQVMFLKKSNVELVIDLKCENETQFSDKISFEGAGINYINFPVSDIAEINFEMLMNVKNEIEKYSGKKLIYCMSGNRVGALFSIILSEVLGHPKERAYEFGCKVGMTKATLQNQIRERFKLTEKVA